MATVFYDACCALKMCQTDFHVSNLGTFYKGYKIIVIKVAVDQKADKRGRIQSTPSFK